MSQHNHREVISNLRRTKRVGTEPLVAVQEPEEVEIIDDEDELASMIVDDRDDLDKEIDQILASVKPSEQPQQAPQLSQEELIRNQILDMLEHHKDAPSKEQIEVWRNKYGANGLQVIAFDPETIYVYTHLTLAQWEKIQKAMQTLQQSGADPDKALKDAVLRYAILWPKITPEHFQGARAGLHSTLFEIMLVNSYFLSPQQAINLTTRL